MARGEAAARRRLGALAGDAAATGKAWRTWAAAAAARVHAQRGAVRVVLHFMHASLLRAWHTLAAAAGALSPPPRSPASA